MEERLEELRRNPAAKRPRQDEGGGTSSANTPSTANELETKVHADGQRCVQAWGLARQSTNFSAQLAAARYLCRVL